MPKLEVASNELVGTDVDFVALVKRGANRIPFRIIKEDTNDMIDLNKIGANFFKKAEKKAGVLAVVVNKAADDIEAIKKTLTENGFSVEEATENETSYVFPQKGVDEFDTGNIMLTPDVGLVVSGLSKSFCGWDFESTTFGEKHKVNSFYPSVRNAVDTYNEMLYDVMQKADTPSEAATLISKAADEFKQYITALATALPERAFKAEVSLIKAEADKKKPKAKDGEEDVTKVAQTEGNGFAASASSPQNKPKTKTRQEEEQIASNASGLPAAAKKDDEDPEVAAAREALAKAEAAAAAKKAEQSPAVGDTASLLKSLSALIDQKFEGVTATVTALKEDLESMSKSVTEVSERTKKAEEALNGTVTSEPNGDRRNVTKSDRTSKGAPPLLDTAYTSNSVAA